jgi:hypothetical protein
MPVAIDFQADQVPCRPVEIVELRQVVDEDLRARSGVVVDVIPR